MDEPRDEPRKESPPSAELSAEEIYRLIREAAYLRAEARNFAPGVELEDWLQAEKEVWEKLRRGDGTKAPR